ncbi:hypothetical protein DPMN_187839 [Dreissena polymorpha]|uniref:Uncharacterized protein n=1 Tax=Dreissena polymorpha TaxID=45954 RepID=A0A9D4I9E5_DREPO|nr:hypothetical protein DPMN_187839 [Dreissena polymorpha]
MTAYINGCDQQKHDETLFCTNETMDAQCYKVPEPEAPPKLVNAKIITLRQLESSQKVKSSISIKQAIRQSQSSVP